MEGLVLPDRLRDRILIWAEEEIRADALPPRSGTVLEAVLYRGAMPRGEVASILGTSEAPGTARHRRSHRSGRACIGEHTRAAAPCFPGKAHAPLDAGAVSREVCLNNRSNRRSATVTASPTPWAAANSEADGSPKTLVKVETIIGPLQDFDATRMVPDGAKRSLRTRCEVWVGGHGGEPLVKPWRAGQRRTWIKAGCGRGQTWTRVRVRQSSGKVCLRLNSTSRSWRRRSR